VSPHVDTPHFTLPQLRAWAMAFTVLLLLDYFNTRGNLHGHSAKRLESSKISWGEMFKGLLKLYSN